MQVNQRLKSSMSGLQTGRETERITRTRFWGYKTQISYLNLWHYVLYTFFHMTRNHCHCLRSFVKNKLFKKLSPTNTAESVAVNVNTVEVDELRKILMRSIR